MAFVGFFPRNEFLAKGFSKPAVDALENVIRVASLVVDVSALGLIIDGLVVQVTTLQGDLDALEAIVSTAVADIAALDTRVDATEIDILALQAAVVPAGGAAGQVLTKDSGTDYDMSWQTPSGGGGGAWTLVSTTVIAAPVAQVDVTGLAGASDIMVGIRLVTASVSGFRVLRLSVDNGATFFTASGDYKTLNGAGTETNATNLGFGTTASTGNISGNITIYAANTVAPKFVDKQGGTGLAAIFTGSTAAVNAIRVESIVSTGNMTGGTIYVWTR